MTTLLEIQRTHLLEELAGQVPDAAVLEAMGRVPRERFVPEARRLLAYYNIPLSIGHGQTISQPYMVAKAAAALQLQGDETVLEVGAGSGYQAAILAELLPFGSVVAVERIPELTQCAIANLSNCGISNVTVADAGAALGCPERGPYDAILVSAAAPCIPTALLQQLTSAGRLVIPIGARDSQMLTRVHPVAAGFKTESLGRCRYVPLLGPGGWPESEPESGSAGNDADATPDSGLPRNDGSGSE